jgi:hypothetical protein
VTKQLFLDYVRNTEARSDTDFHLYDVKTAALAQLLDPKGRAYLAIGLKGVGKSAAFKVLSAGANADIVHAFDAETYQISEEAKPKPTRQYVREVRGELVFQAIRDLVHGARENPTFAATIPADLYQRAQLLNDKLWEKIKDVVNEIGGISILGFGITRRAAGKGKQAPLGEQISSSDYNEAFQIVKGLVGKIHFRTVIDDPESLFTVSDQMNANMVAAVCIAANELMRQLPNLRIIILLKPNVFDFLLKIDEFVSIPIDVRVRLSWTKAELKTVVRKRAEAASFNLDEMFVPNGDAVLDRIVNDSRTGPRDVLNRIIVHQDLIPSGKIVADELSKSADEFAKVSYEQMVGPYDSEYPGLARASIILFEGGVIEFDRDALRRRFDNMIGSNAEIVAWADQEWARNSDKFSELLVEFGLVAIKSGGRTVLPYESDFIGMSKQSDAIFTYIPGMAPKIKFTRTSTSPSKSMQGTRTTCRQK